MRNDVRGVIEALLGEVAHGVEPGLGLRVPTGEVLAPAVEQGAPGQRPGHIGELIQQPVQGLDLAVHEQPRAEDEQQLRRAEQVTGGDPVDDGLPVVTLGFEPGRGACVQLGHPLGEAALRFQPEQVAEQVVVPEPGVGRVETDQQLVRICSTAQPGRATGHAGDGVDERTGELLEDGGLQHASAMIWCDGGEEFVAQVFDDEPVITAERFDEPGGVGGPFEGEAGEHESGGPAFGPVAELPEQCRVQGVPRGAEQPGCLVGGEAQVGAADLGDLVSHA